MIAPSKTPRPSGDRNKSDRRDTDLLVRADGRRVVTAVVVPSATCEAARDLARARQQVRVDLMGAAGSGSRSCCCATAACGTAAERGRRCTASGSQAQTFEQGRTELAFIDNLAACDGLTARKDALDERLSWVGVRPGVLAAGPPGSVAFRGIDTLSALVPQLEVCDFARFLRAVQLGSWLGLVPSRAVRRVRSPMGRSPRPARSTPGGSWSRRPGITPARRGSGGTLYERQEGLPDHVLQIARRAQTRLCVQRRGWGAQQAGQRDHRRVRRAGARLLSLGRRHWRR